jgi:hypothetical protein
MPITQQRNAEMQGLNTADLLSADDKNVAAEFYDAVGGQDYLLGSSTLTLNLDTTALNIAPTVYSLASDIVTIAEAGLYQFVYQVTVKLDGGASHAVTGIWLEEDPATGTFALVPTTYINSTVADIGTSAVTAVGYITKLVGFNYRYRLRLEQNNGSTPMTTVANGSKLSIVRLFKNG